MKNRILFVFLALVLVVSLAAFVACQAEEEVEKPVEYSLDITVVGESTTFPEPGTTTITEGEDVFIRAIPDEGYVFDHWESDVSGTTSPIMVTMTSDKNVVAVFVEAEVAPEEVAALPPINFSIGDAYIRLKGDDLAPYGAELTTPEHESPWTMTIKKGSTITITEIYVSGKPDTLDHNLTIEGTDIDVTLGEGEGAGPFEVTFNEVGTFKVYCKLHPDAHGECLIVVEEPTPEVAALPPIQLTMMDVERGGMRLSGDDLEPYGIDDIPPVHSPWTITIPQGSTITVTIGVSAHPTAGDHHIIIEGSDPPVDVELGLGEELPPRDLTFNEAGTFKAYSKNLPDELQCTIVVVE